MANNVSHLVTVAGAPEAVADFRRRMFDTTGREPVFVFEGLVPMPEIVRDVGRSSQVADGLVILGEDEVPDQFGKTAGEQVETMLAFPWVRDAGVVDRAGLVELLKRRAREAGALDETLKAARRAVRAFRETGHSSEYGWTLEHWGVRGGAYGCVITTDEPGLLEFSFATAWSTPEPIWTRIAEAFPELVVTVLGFEEARHFAVSGEISGGENRVREVEPTLELYERIHGEPYDDEEEDGADGYVPPRGDASEAWRASRAPAPSAPAAPTGWRRYKWDLLGCALAAVVLAVYLLSN